MKSITQEELNEKLELHKLWLLEIEGGKKLDLNNVNLTGVDLIDVNLIDADLRYANLTNVDLTDANLTNADLTGAMLNGTNLTNADLTDVNLTNVDLTDANLTGANLTNADLTDANLTGAKLQWVTHQDIKGESLIVIQFDTSRKNNQLSYWKDLDIWTTGCFQGTLEELIESVNETHKDNVELRNKYLLAMDTILKLSKEE